MKQEWLRLSVTLVWTAAIILASSSLAEEYTDGFSTGLNSSYWFIETNQPLYSVDTTQGGVTFSKPAAPDNGFQYAKLTSKLLVSDDFDLQVNFTNASLTRTGGGVGNQIELVCYFGGRNYYVVRSDESSFGQSVHAWVLPQSPSGGSFGWQVWESISGTLRLTRSRATLSFWVDSTLLHQWTWNSSDMTFAMFLVNNGTRDATSVTFDDFFLSADKITYPPLLLNIQPLASDQVLLSWPAYPPGYALETTSDLSALAPWQAITNGLVLAENQIFHTNATSEAAKFYRLRKAL